MKHVPTMLKSAILALCVLTASTASAVYTRSAEGNGGKANTEKSANARAQASFRKFLDKHSGLDNKRLSPDRFGANQPAATPRIAQRPKNVLRSAAVPTGKINAIVPLFMGMQGYNEAFYGTLDPIGGIVVPTFTGPNFTNGDVENVYLQTGCVREGIIYIPDVFYDEIGMVTFEAKVRYKRFDLDAGKWLDPIVFGSSEEDMRFFLYAMTYDDVDDVIYGLSYNMNTDGKGGVLVKIECSGDPQTWKAQELGDVGGETSNWMASLVWNPMERKLYGLNARGAFCEIDLSVSPATALPVYQYDDFDEYFCYPMADLSSAMCYSPYDHAYFFSYYSADATQFAIVGIDAETYEAFNICHIEPTSYVTMLYCSDPYAEDNAPQRMAAPTITFKDAELTGTYEWCLPTTLFNGLALDEPVTLHVTLDGEEIYTGTHPAGSVVTKEFTVTQGYHKMIGYATLGDLKGPMINSYFYTGYDAPLAPSGLKLENGILTWNAPKEGSVHGGYLNPANIKYNVYLNGEIFKKDITDTQCELVINEVMNGRATVQVSAIADGVESEKSSSLSRTIGKGVSLPVTLVPTPLEADQFEIINVTNDAYTFTYNESQYEYPLFRLFTTDYSVAPDDWLILPPIYFDSKDDLYSIIFRYNNGNRSSNFFDDLDVCIGKDPLAASMTKVIYTHTGREQATATDINARFMIDEPGTYYIGFHSKNPGKPRYRGIQLSNFRVQKDEGSTKAPGLPTNIIAEPAAKGDLSYNITATLPTISLNGEALPADADIKLHARTDADEKTVSGKPGQTVNVNVEVMDDGNAPVIVFASSDEGEGIITTIIKYVGLDVPVAPVNIQGKISADNLAIDLTWDPVSSVGQNGGYVDANDITYDMYNHSGITSTKVGTAGNATNYTFRVGATTQAVYNVSPVAVNRKGNSINGTVFTELLGKPHKTPMIEDFGYSAFSYQKWTFNTLDGFNGVEFGHCTDTDGIPGTPQFNVTGGLRATGFGVGELRAPKVTTEDIDHAKIKIRYWDYAQAGDMELWARSYADQELKKIASLSPTRGATPQWQEWEFPLPDEYAHQPWIQVNFRVNLKNGQEVLIDDYQLLQNADYDMMITSISAPYNCFVGETPSFDIVVTNSGAERNSGTLKVDLVGNGSVLESQTVEIGNVRSGEVFEYSAQFPMTEKHAKYEILEVVAQVTAPQDENGSNDVQTVEFIINDHTLPIVRDLEAKRLENGEDVELTWSEPDRTAKGLESFENYKSFGNPTEIGGFLNVDIDGAQPFVFDDPAKRWTGDDENSAWTVIDCEALGTMNDERVHPHSGTRMLMARSIGYADTEQPKRSGEFLVSPEIVGGTKVSFWINTISPTYTETFQVWYSTTDRNLNPADYDTESKDVVPRKCGSFNWLQNFTKSGAETWEQVELTLPKEAKYFAIVYGSFGQFGGMIDDLIYTPKEPAMIDIDSYDLYISYEGNEPQIVVADIKDTKFTHVTGNNYRATYYLKTVTEDQGQYIMSPFSNGAFVDGVNSVGELEAGEFVGAAKGHVLVGGAYGKEFKLFDAEGRVVIDTILREDRKLFACPAGVYVAKLGDATVKVIVR